MAYTDYSISNTSGYETEEERRRREAAGQVGSVNPETIANYSLASTPSNQVDQSTMGLQIPQSQQMQNIQMGQPAVQNQTTVVGQQPVVGGQSTVETVTPHPVQQHLDMYQTAQTDPSALLKMSQDQNAPEWLRGRAREQAANILNQERGFQQAQEQMKTMSPDDLESNLRKKTTDGSWLKAIMYGALGMEQSAQAEAAKLGIGKESAVMGADGTPYMIKTAFNGTPIEGYNATTGKKLTPQELVSATAGAQVAKGTTTHTGKMQDVTTGEIYYERTTPQGIQLVDTNGKRYSGATNNLRAYGIGSDINTKNQIQLNSLRNEFIAKPSEAAAKTLMEAAAKADPGDGSEIARVQQLIRTLPMPSGGGIPSTAVNQPPTQSIPLYDAQGRPTMSASPAATTPAATTPAAPIEPTPIKSKDGKGGTGAVSGGARRQGESFDAYTQRMAIAKTQAENKIGVEGARSKAFNDILDTEVRPQAQAGDTVSSTRKQQFQIFDRPDVDMNKIFGLATGAGRSAGDQSWTMIRDVLLGKFEGRTDDIKQRAAALGLSPAEQSALAEYQIANVAVNSANLKKTAGPGSVSDAEQKVNREAGMDPTKVPALGAYNVMAQSQFDADKQRYKGDWAESHPAQNALQLDKAWRVESQKLTGMYSDIAKERTKFIAGNGSTTAAVKEGYKRFPIPEYDPSSGQWKKTKPLTSYNR